MRPSWRSCRRPRWIVTVEKGQANVSWGNWKLELVPLNQRLDGTGWLTRADRRRGCGAERRGRLSWREVRGDL